MALANESYAAVAFDPEWARKYFGEPGRAMRVCAKLQEQAEQGKRHAQRIWFEIMGIIGQQTQIAVLVQQQIGVSVDQAKVALQLVEDSRQLGEDQRLDMAINALIRHARLNPGDARLKPLAEALAPMNQSAA
jgi:hypothetical protein